MKTPMRLSDHDLPNWSPLPIAVAVAGFVYLTMAGLFGHPEAIKPAGDDCGQATTTYSAGFMEHLSVKENSQ